MSGMNNPQPMAQSHLRAVKRAADQMDRAREKLRAAIVAAHESGESIRDIAPHAGLSPSRVHELLREQPKG